MFVTPFSFFWISLGLYPSDNVSDTFLSKSLVRRFKGFSTVDYQTRLCSGLYGFIY